MRIQTAPHEFPQVKHEKMIRAKHLNVKQIDSLCERDVNHFPLLHANSP